jgi:hypothetical protein
MGVNQPLTTKLRDYGQFMHVEGNFGDQFLIRVMWDGVVLVYSMDGDDLHLIWQYENLGDLLRAVPGFDIIRPEILSKSYIKNNPLRFY